MKGPKDTIVVRQTSDPRPVEPVSPSPILTHGKSTLNATTTIHWAIPIVIVVAFLLLCVLCAAIGAHVHPAQ
jgi:hypothetical protein